MFERLRQTSPVDRLQQVIHGVEFEGLHGVLVEGSAKDDVRARLRQAGGDIDAGAARHLNIEEDGVGTEFNGHLHGLGAVFGFPGDLDIGMSSEQLAQSGARRGFIVGYEDANQTMSPTARLETTDLGKVSDTRVPLPLFCQVSRAESP